MRRLEREGKGRERGDGRMVPMRVGWRAGWLAECLICLGWGWDLSCAGAGDG